MAPPHSIVISASRRTDIPAFFMPWFMQSVLRGEFEVVHPFTRRIRKIPATIPPVHTVVFWSKNFDPFLKGEYGLRLQEMGYHLYFQFTLNSHNSFLEPHLPDLARRIEQLHWLCDRFGPAAVSWRLDPICVYRFGRAGRADNLDGIDRIAKAAATAGIYECTTSFMDLYPKILKRTAQRPGFGLLDPSLEEKIMLLMGVERQLAVRGIALFTCCEAEVLNALPAHSKIRAGACIPSARLMQLYGGTLSLKRDSGQRVKAGCKCRTSVDVGSYDLQRCRHNCLYCYARPVTEQPVTSQAPIS